MKYRIFILIILFISNINIYTQVVIDEPVYNPRRFIFVNEETNKLNRAYFEQDSYVLTSQWWGYTPMLDALKFNSVQGSTGFDNFLCKKITAIYELFLNFSG